MTFEDYDAQLLLKRNGEHERAGVNFDTRRGKFWLFLHDGDGDVLCIEAPRLRVVVAEYEQRLRESGLPPCTPDGYLR